MNELLKELAEQCGFRSNPDVYDRNQSFDIAKFAELIVKECAYVADKNQAEDMNWPIGNILKEHFGVEE